MSKKGQRSVRNNKIHKYVSREAAFKALRRQARKNKPVHVSGFGE